MLDAIGTEGERPIMYPQLLIPAEVDGRVTGLGGMRLRVNLERVVGISGYGLGLDLQYS